MKAKRNLSGIYFRIKDEESERWGPLVFEDLTEEQQDELLKGRTGEWLSSLVKKLANTINRIGDQFDIYSD